MEIILTTCCKEKCEDAGLVPAELRYTDSRIEKVKEIALHQNKELFFFSGKFGLIHKSTQIPWYDRVLQEEDMLPLVTQMTATLKAYEISAATFYAYPRDTDGWENYYSVIEEACKLVNVKLSIILINKEDL